MFDRFSRSWTLVKASASVLRQDKELLVFPLISSIALMVVMASFALPLLGTGYLQDMMDRHGGEIPAPAYVIVFLFYFAHYFVIFFFNSALVGAAMIRLEGGDPTVRDGLRIASSKIVVILCYAFIAATVGVILKLIQERVGAVGKIVVALVGAAWSIATFLVVPVLVHEDVGPIEAVRESASLLKKTWGENVIGQAGMGMAFGLIFFAICGVGSILMMLTAKSVFLMGIAFALIVLALAFTALVQAALGGIYAAALYRYATTGEQSPGFGTETLQHAFAPKPT